MELKLQRYTKTYPLKTCNFKKECVPNLIYDEVIQDGLIVKELYYGDYDQTDLIVEVDITYTYGADTLIERMDFDVNYYDDDNKIGMTIKKVKKLTKRQKLGLLKKRRKTISEDAQANVLGLLRMSYPEEDMQNLLNLGGSFIIKNKHALEVYESAGSPQIVSDLASATEYWLDATPSALGGATIRQYLIGAFSA